MVANLTGTGVQNLRAYEKAGLVHPQRTDGGTRLYSSADVARLRRITLLLDAGLNLAGIAMVLNLEDDNERLRKQVARERDNRAARSAGAVAEHAFRPTATNDSPSSAMRERSNKPTASDANRAARFRHLAAVVLAAAATKATPAAAHIALARSASSRRFLAASTEARRAATRSTTSASLGASASSASGTPSALLCTTVSSASR